MVLKSVKLVKVEYTVNANPVTVWNATFAGYDIQKSITYIVNQVGPINITSINHLGELNFIGPDLIEEVKTRLNRKPEEVKKEEVLSTVAKTPAKGKKQEDVQVEKPYNTFESNKV